MKEYHYVIKYTDKYGWEIDPDTESANFPEGTIYDTGLEEWQFGYLGEGQFNGREEELTEVLSNLLSLNNTMEGVSA
jgi:hypothetical protein